MKKGFTVEISKMTNLDDRNIELLKIFNKKTSNYYSNHQLYFSKSDYIFPSLDTFDEGRKILEWVNKNKTITSNIEVLNPSFFNQQNMNCLLIN